MGKVYSFLFLVVALIQFATASELKANASNGLHQNQRLQYPELRRDESIIDDYYGRKVADPYRYLEDVNSDEVKTFIAAQNKITEEYLGRNSLKKKIEKRITEVYNYPKYGVPGRYGSRYYYSMNTGLQNQDVYYVQDSIKGQSRVFFDPNTLSSDGTVHLSEITFSEFGELVALGLSSKGSDWKTVRIRNVSSGVDFPETLQDIKFTRVVWSKDTLGLFYAHYPKLESKSILSSVGTETFTYGNQKLYYHRVGTSQDEDVLLLEFEDPQLLFHDFKVTEDGKYLIILLSKGTGESMVYFASLEELSRGVNAKLQITPIVEKIDNEYDYVASEGSVIYLKTNYDAPNYRIVGIDLNNPDQKYWSNIVAEHKNKILETARNVDTDKIVLKYLVNVTNQLEVRSLTDGKLIQRIDTPSGTIATLWGKRSENEIFFNFVSFLTPGIIYRVELKNTPYKAEVSKEVKVPGLDPTKFVTKQVFYPSKDGTLVPMFIVHKKDLKLNGSASTLLYGYGGFNINILPYFNPATMVFLQNFDGIYAVPNIRGGGEYGGSWHDDGRSLNKQNSFDDFQAAAQFLINEKYTTASKLAINGASNGGLLVAACINQRPDLFRAAIAQVGVHDLLRFQKFTIGYAWCPEYGCFDDGNQTIFDNLYRLSPLHNVRLPIKEKVQYPAVLLTTADHDDRVVPLHSYKLIAELQYKIGQSPKQTNPLLIKIQTSSGHGGGKPTLKRIAELAEIYTFLVESAGFVFTE